MKPYKELRQCNVLRIIFFRNLFFAEKRHKTETKTEKPPTCAVFSKNRHFEDIKYDIKRSVNRISKKLEIQKDVGVTYISDVVFLQLCRHWRHADGMPAITNNWRS